MKNTLKLQVLFTTLIDSSKSEILCKIPNTDLIDGIISRGIQNSSLDYAIAYLDSFPTFDQFEISYVEWVRIIDIEKNPIKGPEYQRNVNVEVVDEFDPDTFDVEFGYDRDMDTELPKYIIIDNVYYN